MSHNLMDSSIVGFCTEIVKSLTSIAATNAPERMFRKVGLLEWLKSPQNAPGDMVSIIKNANDNTIADCRVVYRQRGIEADVVTDPDDNQCQGSERPLFQDLFAIETYAGSPGRRISRERFRQLCAGGSPLDGFMAEEVLADMNALRVHIDEAVMTHLSTTCIGVNLGNIVSAVPSSAAKGVTLLDADGNPIVYGISTIRQDMSKNQLNGPFAMIGEGILQLFSYQSSWGCCNDGGLDIGSANQWVNNNLLYWADHSADGILGDNNFLVLTPGLVQLPTFTENSAAGEVQYNGNYAHMTIPDPRIPGLMYDLDIHYDDCAKDWVFRMGVHYEPWCLPADVFETGDELRGMSGAFLYTAVQS